MSYSEHVGLIEQSTRKLSTTESEREFQMTRAETVIINDLRQTYSNYGDRCFAAAGLKLWNSLPADLRQADISFQRFQRLLKTFLFGC